MSNFLAYLQHYWRKDEKEGRTLKHEWGTKTDYLHKRIKQGDVIWVVTTGGLDFPGEWRLLQRISVQKLYTDKINHPEYPYRIVGDKRLSRIFDPALQTNMESLLKRLEFVSGRKITKSRSEIGLTLRNVRPLLDSDGELLRRYADAIGRKT